MAHTADNYRVLVSGRRRGAWAGLSRGALWLLSVPYGWVTRLRNRLFDRGWKPAFRAAVPVISVGNLTLGGTGKTPCVEYVARFYQQREVRVAILSRGYGSDVGRNDEALVLEENLPDVPHLQGADRAALARIAVEELESEVLVLDDGFQHRRLARQVDLVLIDATEPWGYGYLFPRGLLRESPRSLRRATAAILTRCDQVSAADRAAIARQIERHAPGLALVETAHRPVELVNADRMTESLDRLRERPFVAFCGIGNSEAFRRTLEDLGARLDDFRVYPDHHPYTRADVDDLRHWASRQATECLVVTTEKDLVKLRLSRLDRRELWALRIRLEVTAGQEMLDRVLASAVETTGTL